MSARRPWFKFYPADWQGDEKLRVCSGAARNLWLECMCIMHRADPYGHLVVHGRPVTDSQLAVLAGIPPDQVPALMAELETAGVSSRNRAGVLYSRRMTRDAKRSKDGDIARITGAKVPGSRRYQLTENIGDKTTTSRVACQVAAQPPSRTRSQSLESKKNSPRSLRSLTPPKSGRCDKPSNTDRMAMSDAKRGRGFRSIGDLASGIADTPTMPVTTTAGSSVKLRISSTTTPPTETSSPITPPHGPRGLTALPGSLRAMAQGNDPAATDRNLLACLEPLLSLSEKRDWNISDPTRIGELSGFLIRHDASETDIRQAEELIAVSIKPLAPQALMAELVRLRALTVSRQTGDDDTAAILAAYASELEPGTRRYRSRRVAVSARRKVLAGI